MAGASMPSADAKAWAWGELTTNRARSNYELNALAQGFWASGEPDVLRPYAARYFADVPAMSAWVGDDALARVATLAYPSRVVEEDTAALSRAALQRGDLTAAVRRSIVDAQSQLEEALRSRATFG
jgi:aminopeptidase N